MRQHREIPSVTGGITHVLIGRWMRIITNKALAKIVYVVQITDAVRQAQGT